ncbi:MULTISPECIES: RICIN domain-containing protein [unclassified Streptomyces]|uniref:RICIN domain-containing protein n=1 Tax=unclassified Streptomyces TaxID=2593676 RepID=UPI001BE63F7B|nr:MULTISPECIES: RICIN domain-containing protein [unclassified Streptomyces]MBT2408528.1 RICIN domain-containing protein [Streptomyces sp. ISL-21]MBT2458085.1 RICIN domain-containing protein [Streptomyces sp. ISL-86]MBT2611965.1 RICIN domain-containing protein [Streptomyces sp. ISL-87]
MVLLAALTAFCTSWGLAAPVPANADTWHQSTRLTNRRSGLEVSVISAGCRDMACLNGRGLRLESGAGSIFALVDVPGGSEIRWSHDKCLDAAGFGTTNGTPVILWDCTGTTNQLWEIQGFYGPGADLGSVLLVNKLSGKCLDARNPSFPTPPPPMAVLQIWDCVKKPKDPWIVNQAWEFHF